MKRHDDTLRSLDAAAGTMTAAEQDRAAATLDRIVATAPGDQDSRQAAPAPVPPARRRLVTVLTAVIALSVGWVALQGVGGNDAAYASWTADPAEVASDDRDAAASACRSRLGSPIDPEARLVLAERRGDHLVLLFRTDDPDMSSACLVRRPQGSTRTRVMGIGAGGSSGPAQEAPARGFTEGAISQFGDDVSVTDGAVGDEVTGVTIHAGDLSVNASVENGRYAAWWPGPAFGDEDPGPSGMGGPEPILTYDLTLADGTVIRDAEPTRPR